MKVSNAWKFQWDFVVKLTRYLQVNIDVDRKEFMSNYTRIKHILAMLQTKNKICSR